MQKERRPAVSGEHCLVPGGRGYRPLLRELTIDAARDYQPMNAPRLVADVVRHVSMMS